MSSRREFVNRMILGLAIPTGLAGCASARRADGSTGAAASGTAAGLEPIDVRAHGAEGDGESDDTAAIERAAGAGENLLFLPGRYRVTRDLILDARLELMQGAVLAVDRGPATLTISGSVDAGLYQIFSGRIAFASGSVPEVYPQWWGARGDGVHDDTLALQAAINTRSVRLPAGKYRTTRPLEAKNGLRLQGSGNLWSPEPTRDSWIFYDGPEDREAAVLRASQASVGTEPDAALSNVSVRDIVLDGGNKAGFGLYVAYCTDDSAFSDIAAIRTTRHGVWADKLWYARFENIVARDNLGCGITIGRRMPQWSSSSVVNGIYLANLRAHSNGLDEAYDEEANPEWGYGIGFYPTNAVTLRNAVSEHNFGPGIVFGLPGGSSNAIEGFYLEDNAVAARRAGQASRNWGLVVVGHPYARGNEIVNGSLGGSVGRTSAQSIWLRGPEPEGPVVMKNVAFGQHIRADWGNYRLDGAIYYGLRNYIEGVAPARGARDDRDGDGAGGF